MTLVTILDYHQRSKHHVDRYAPGPGYLDWASQPDPFRSFDGCERIALPLRADALATRYNDLRRGVLPPPAPFDVDNVALLLELALGLSAWKQYGRARWALRCNPSSGNLHPTEGYVIATALPGLAAGVYHYVSRDHCLERRAAVPQAAWDGAPGVFVALTSIYWREAWKYGMRAFRYCQHDCGHAIAALAYAAAALGWHTRLCAEVGDDALAALAGIDRDCDFAAAEREAPDALLWIGATAAMPDAIVDTMALAASLRHAAWQGHANRLSDAHVEWRDIDAAHAATCKPATPAASPWRAQQYPGLSHPAHDIAAAALMRQRRSAVDFDGVTTTTAAAFFGMLDATLPRANVPPWQAWPEPPAVHPALFVHRVEGLEPGLYCLLRDAAALGPLRAAMRSEWLWRKVGPTHLPLYLLLPHDLRQVAQLVSCHQEIAAASCYSLGMIAAFAGVDREPWRYRRLYWECGMIGQVLYLEAEAAGLRGTGIGCFFDDEMHRLLGLKDTAWQSLYHFTVGGAVDDPRLMTLPPYAAR